MSGELDGHASRVEAAGFRADMSGMERTGGGVDKATAARHIKAALRGPVMRTLGEGIPEVRNMPGLVAYDKVMGDIALLDQCFRYFRASRDKFRAILVDDQQREVNDDAAKLSCGRTLNEVIAMVVRSAASRYFVRRLGDVRPLKAAPTEKRGLLASALAVVRGPRPAPLQPSRSKAELLYEAICEYLLYEWQVPLVPAYSQLTAKEVTRLGPRLMDLRSEDDLMTAAGRPRLGPVPAAAKAAVTLSAVAAAGEPPAKVTLDEVLTADHLRLRVEAIGGVLADAEIRQVAKNGEQEGALISILGQVGAGLVRALVIDLGLDKRQMTVCLLTAQKALPPSAFETLCRASENDAPMLRFMAGAKRAGLGPRSSLDDCAAALAALAAGSSRPQ